MKHRAMRPNGVGLNKSANLEIATTVTEPELAVALCAVQHVKLNRY